MEDRLRRGRGLGPCEPDLKAALRRSLLLRRDQPERSPKRLDAFEQLVLPQQLTELIAPGCTNLIYAISVCATLSLVAIS